MDQDIFIFHSIVKLMLGVEMDWLFSEKDTIIHNALYPTPSWQTPFNTL